MVQTTAENANEHVRRTDLVMLAAAREWITSDAHKKLVEASVEQMGLDGPFYHYALQHEQNLDAMVIRGFLAKQDGQYRITDAGERLLEQLQSEFGDTVRMAS